MPFRQQLEDAALSTSMSETRLVRILASGRTPRPTLQRFSLKVLAGAQRFPSQLIRLYHMADNPDAKLHILENLMEEEGVVLDSHNLRQIDTRRHVRWAMSFCTALGVPPDIQAAAQDNADDDIFAQYLAQADWLCAMAYLLIGWESNLPRTYTPIIQGLRKQGFDATALSFFTKHIVADTKHGRVALDLAARLTPQARQTDVLEAVRRGAHRWWALFNSTSAD